MKFFRYLFASFLQEKEIPRFSLGRPKACTKVNGVTEIPVNGFKDCCNLQKLTLPDSLHKIEFTAFKNCVSLSEVINLHDGVKYGRAFNDAPLLKNVIPAQ